MVPDNTPRTLWTFETGGSVRSSPAAVHGVVYVGSDDGCLYAISACSGRLIWRFQTGDSIRSSPAISQGIVYVGSNDGNVYAISEITGELHWSFTTEYEVSSSPAILNNVIYIGSGDGNLYALSAFSGQEIWKFFELQPLLHLFFSCPGRWPCLSRIRQQCLCNRHQYWPKSMEVLDRWLYRVLTHRRRQCCLHWFQ